MASKTPASSPLLLIIFNLLSFALVSSTHVPCSSPTPPPKHKAPKPYYPKPAPPPKFHGHENPKPYYPKPTPPPYHHKDTCPLDTLKLGVCANLLNDLVHLVIGTPPDAPYCCNLIKNLADLEAAACLCTVVKAKVLGLKITVPVSLSLILNQCGRKVPSGFQCK